MRAPSTYSALQAQQRAASLLDPGSFQPLVPESAAVSCVVGSGAIAGTRVLVALTDGHVRGGTIGVAEASALACLAEIAVGGPRLDASPVLIVGFDTGGVRVEEGPMALAAASAVGVSLARMTLRGVHVVGIISGPRGCFGAMAVMAGLPERRIMTAGAGWGVTGPKLLGTVLDGASAESHATGVTSAATRLANGDVDAVVPDRADAVRAQLRDHLADIAIQPARSVPESVAQSVQSAQALWARFKASGARSDAAPPSRPRRRDLLRYSFRGQWQPSGPMQRRGLVQAAFGTLGDRSALALILGPESGDGGIGIEEAAAIAEMVQLALQMQSPRAAIITFLFCQGHKVDYAQERFGLPRALAECLRVMVAARLLGHPIVSVLGGGTYGAAYLALAAPSHRILAMRGTAVAPMAPDVLHAFQALRGRRAGEEPERQLAELIPDIRMVDSVIRLPRVLRHELLELLATVQPEVG